MQGTDLPERPAESGFTWRTPGLLVTSLPRPAWTEIALIGELDHGTRPTFDRAVSRCLWAGPPTLVLRLDALDFLAVAGAHAFEDAAGRCLRRNGELVVVNPVRAVRRLLCLVGLAGLVVPDRR